MLTSRDRKFFALLRVRFWRLRRIVHFSVLGVTAFFGFEVVLDINADQSHLLIHKKRLFLFHFLTVSVSFDAC